MLIPYPRRLAVVLAACAIVACSSVRTTVPSGSDIRPPNVQAAQWRDLPVYLKVIDYRPDAPSAGELITAISQALQAAVGRGGAKLVETSPTLEIVVSVTRYEATFSAATWTGCTDFKVATSWNDHAPATVPISRCTSGFNVWGYKTADDVLAHSLSQALSDVIQRLDETITNQPPIVSPAPWRNGYGDPALPAGGGQAFGQTQTVARTLAVLELRNQLKFDKDALDLPYFTDQIRSGALKVNPSLNLITRENLVVLLESSGRKAADCEGECEIETGRRVGADVIISGEGQRIGNIYKLTLKLHDTHSGRLLSGVTAAGRTIEDLDLDVGRAVQELVQPLR